MAESQKHPAEPFPLLELIPELLELVFVKYFEPAKLTVSHLANDPRITGIPSLNIERTCRQLRDLSIAVRTKVIPRELVAENNGFLPTTLPVFCDSENFVWAREHITSLQIILKPEIDFRITRWDFLTSGFPNLKNLELRVTKYEKHSLAVTRSYLPLDKEENQRRLALDVVNGDWDSDRMITLIKRNVYLIEEFRRDILGFHALWEGFGNYESTGDTFNIRVNFSTIAVDDQGCNFYCANTTYKSEGPFDGDWIDEDFGLTVLSKRCQVGAIVEMINKGIEEKQEESSEDLPVWDLLENLV